LGHEITEDIKTNLSGFIGGDQQLDAIFLENWTSVWRCVERTTFLPLISLVYSLATNSNIVYSHNNRLPRLSFGKVSPSL
jgi:hypothetical protein